MTDREKRLSMALKQESENVVTTPHLRRRIDARLRPTGTLRNRALAISLAVVLLIAGAIGWLVNENRSVKQGLTGPAPQAAFFAGYWPVTNEADARAMQKQVDDGAEQWRLDPWLVAEEYAKSLGWTEGDVSKPGTQVNGSSADGWTAFTTIAPKLADGKNGPQHSVSLIGLKGTDRPAWFVTGISSENISVDKPVTGDEIGSFTHISGDGQTYEGRISVTVVDDVQHKLGQTQLNGGSTERAHFDGGVDVTKASSRDGIVMFEGANGSGGPSTDLTVVRVRFADAESPASAPYTDLQMQAAADDAFHCFFDARHNRDFEAAKQCVTDGYKTTANRDNFMCCSSPWLQRAVIVSSARSGDKVVFDALLYWATSGVGPGGVEFVSEDTLTTVFSHEQMLVDSWKQGDSKPVTATDAATMSFLALGDTPKCSNGMPTPDSFTTAVRKIPREPVLEDFALSAVRDLVTGHWSHEPDGSGPFSPGTRVDSVRVLDADRTVEVILKDFTRSRDCDFAGIALARTIRSIAGLENAKVVLNGEVVTS